MPGDNMAVVARGIFYIHLLYHQLKVLECRQMCRVLPSNNDFK
jgi:hypothetical protein